MPSQNSTQTLPIILDRLRTTYPGAQYELRFETPLQLLVATILAARCTDERVNKVTSVLFGKYRSAQEYASADVEGLAEDIRTISFNRQKARAIRALAQTLVEKHEGDVPARMDDLMALPGVARKTANVVLNNAFGSPSGVIVDTHVARVSQRLGLTEQQRPVKIELDLMALVPREEWVYFGSALVLHGRYTYKAHAPICSGCVMSDLCPKFGLEED